MHQNQDFEHSSQESVACSNRREFLARLSQAAIAVVFASSVTACGEYEDEDDDDDDDD